MNYYEVLGIEKDASRTDIKKAYRKAALHKHPDKSGDREEFERIKEAYECLIDEASRQFYDQHGSAPKAEASLDDKALSLIASLANNVMVDLIKSKNDVPKFLISRLVDPSARLKSMILGRLRSELIKARRGIIEGAAELKIAEDELKSLGKSVSRNKKKSNAYQVVESTVKNMIKEGELQIEGLEQNKEVIEHALQSFEQLFESTMIESKTVDNDPIWKAVGTK